MQKFIDLLKENKIVYTLTISIFSSIILWNESLQFISAVTQNNFILLGAIMTTAIFAEIVRREQRRGYEI